MTRTRRAILIESGHIAVAPTLDGASQDLKNWVEYLQTPLGGCWDVGKEIVQMSHPSLEDLETELMKLSGCDYAFITFSGHGGHNVTTSEDFIFLNNSEIITIDRIVRIVTPIVDKAVFIVDACRDNKNPPANFKYSDYREQAKSLLENVKIPHVDCNRKVLLEGNFLKSYSSPKSTNIGAFQNKWWEMLGPKPNGVFLLQSCSQNETTAEGLDGVQQFGLFSRSMLDAAYKKTFSDELSVNDAFEFAKGQVLFNAKETQNPEISSPCPYPFAVKIGMHKTFRDFYNESVFNDTPQKNFYDGKQILLEFQTYKPIPGTKKSYRIDKECSFTHVQKHAHVYAKPNGKGKELYAVNLDGSGHDGSKHTMEPYEIEFFKNLGFTIPDNGVIECRTYLSAISKDELFILLS